ncbi:MAG: 3-hydroxyacyl-[acyl-carrier-protein] dehydratase FabZ [Desulfuromonas sp.]|nr:MAG: 3-hydroxyacyl-[acyl-carrier-protein] dehydratase FabZ [Desulfuromonas sp.]
MVYGIKEIMEMLPHRYPFLLVDSIAEVVEGKKIVGIKNVTINEPFFQGHFPGHPVMPGVLIVEAMAQVGGILGQLSHDHGEDPITYFVGIDKARFRKPVVPGDILRMEVEVVNFRRGIYTFTGKSFVGSTLVAEAELKATFVDRGEKK